MGSSSGADAGAPLAEEPAVPQLFREDEGLDNAEPVPFDACVNVPPIPPAVWWKKALLALASAAVGMLGLSLFQGCGHSVDVTPGRTEVCKDGSCLVIEQGHISYSQAQPETDVPPVVQSLKK